MAMRVTYTNFNGRIVAENRGGVQKSYVRDALGNTIALLDSTQSKTDTWTYWPYGEVQNRTGTTPTPMQFVGTAGYYSNYEEGGAYIRARELASRYTTWHSLSRIWPEEPAYCYSTSSPVAATDPAGLQTETSGLMGGNIGSCNVMVCSVYGWEGGIGGGVPTHKFICVQGPGGGCEGGLYPNNGGWGGGHVEPDRLYPCGGRSGGGILVKCESVSTSCNVAAAACDCLKNAQRNPGWYIFPVRTCYSFPTEIVDCACDALPTNLDRVKCHLRVHALPVVAAP